VNRDNKKMLLQGMFYFILGASISISTLIPTLLNGFGSGAVENNIVFNFKNILEIPNLILKFLMLASYEVSRFIGHDTPSRLDYLAQQVWVIPFVIFLLLVGFLQVAYFILSFFRKNDLKEWQKVKRFTLGSLLLLSFSFLFSVTQPRSHTFYILYPVAIWYSFYCYGNLFKHNIRLVAILILASGIVFHTSIFVDNLENRSLFANRNLVMKAITEKDYSLLGVRRESNVMLNNRDPLWKNREPSIRYTGFEVETPYFKPQNIVGNIKYDGNFSCKVDSIQPYSVSFSEQLGNLDNPRKVKVSFWAISKQEKDFSLVYEIADGEEITWTSAKLEFENSRNNEWELVELELNLPEYSLLDSKISLYFWMSNKSGATLNLDDLKLEFGC